MCSRQVTNHVLDAEWKTCQPASLCSLVAAPDKAADAERQMQHGDARRGDGGVGWSAGAQLQGGFRVLGLAGHPADAVQQRRHRHRIARHAHLRGHSTVLKGSGAFISVPPWKSTSLRMSQSKRGWHRLRAMLKRQTITTLCVLSSAVLRFQDLESCVLDFVP